jgi:hypothetical protein
MTHKSKLYSLPKIEEIIAAFGWECVYLLFNIVIQIMKNSLVSLKVLVVARGWGAGKQWPRLTENEPLGKK